MRAIASSLWGVALVALTGGMSACSPDPAPIPDGPPAPQANQMQEAIQKPINATGQAIEQVEDTQKRLDETLGQMSPVSNPPPPPLPDGT
jgi:hypothetical protein